jgi:Uma2 family endonuclease
LALPIPEAWLINVSGRRVELHAEPVNGVYQIVHISQRGDGAQSHALPEFRLAVNDILGWHGAPHRKKNLQNTTL